MKKIILITVYMLFWVFQINAQNSSVIDIDNTVILNNSVIGDINGETTINVNSGGNLTINSKELRNVIINVFNNGKLTIDKVRYRGIKNVINNYGSIFANKLEINKDGVSVIKIKNDGDIDNEDYNGSENSVFINCGLYKNNKKFDLNGGKLINTGTFNSDHFLFGGVKSIFDNYGLLDIKQFSPPEHDGFHDFYNPAIKIDCPDFNGYNKYRTTQDGEWNNNTFEGTINGTDWVPTIVPSPTTSEIIIKHNIVNELDVSVSKLYIDSVSSLTNNGSVILNDTLTLAIKDNNSSELINNGDVINNGVVRVRKYYKKEEEWVYMSFPFDVTENHIFYAGTHTIPSWGGAKDNGYIFYVADYDGYNRNLTSQGPPSYSGTGVYWMDVNPKILKKRKGYIIAADYDLNIDFVSASGDNYVFQKNATFSVSKYNTSPYPVHRSWNLVGLPYLSSYDLLGVNIDAPFYYYDYKNKNYSSVMSGDSYVLKPFTSFFLQAWGAPNQITYSSNLLRAATANDFDDIEIQVSNEKYSDKTRIQLKDGSSNDFVIGQDAVKMFSPVKAVPQIYTKANNYNSSVNALPIGAPSIDLNINIGEAGDYVVSIKDIDKINNVKKITLIDQINGNKTDLLPNYSYNFHSNVGNNIKRFKLLFDYENIPTEEELNIIQYNDNAVITNAYDDLATVNVYDMTGRLIKTYYNVQSNETLTLTQNGLYVIELKTKKTSIKRKFYKKS